MLLRRLGLVTVLALFLGGGSALSAGSPDVVVSQVYGGGGNMGATYTNDFVELFNRGTAAASVAGWSVQYASAAGTSWQKTDLPSATLQPGQYLLVQEAQGAGGTTPLPTPDATGSIAMSATAGKVALVTSTTLLACGATNNCLPDASIRDFVGYGSTATSFEGSGPTANLTNTTAALRGAAGCTDNDSNSSDFATGPPTPRNTATPSSPCPLDAPPSVSSTSPANGASGVPLGANLTLTFSEPVDVTGAWFSIACASSGSHTATASGGPTTFTLDPDVDFATEETCTVTVLASQVADQDTVDPPDTMASDFSFTFRTAAAERPIHEIQGAGHRSPLVGQAVSTSGIVTAKLGNGFYLQDPTPDADDATSEGIFVFTSSSPSAVAVGDSVQLGANVSEFRPGSSANANLSTTELTSPSITVLSHGNPLPAPVVIGTGGRVPPNTVIEDDAAGSVETSGVFDPDSDGIDFYESLEGMLVQVNDAVAVGPTNTFGETPVVGDGGANASLRTPRGGILLRPTDPNPERIVVDDSIVSVPSVDVGDRYTTPLVGPLDFNFGNFMLHVTATPTVTPGGLARETTSPLGVGQLSVATFNVENLDPNDPPSKFASLASLIVNNLRSPDLLSLEEVQDNNGAVDDGVVDASATYNALIAAIQAAGGPTYQFRQIDPVNDQDGGEPGGNIRVGFLFRTDTGLSFVDRPGGGSTTATGVVDGAGGPELTFSPGRIDPTNAAFSSSRKPLAGEFTYDGKKLFVIANHFNSKGGDDPLFGRFQPPTRSSEVQRHQQAQIVHDFVAQVTALDPNARVVVLGDLNDFEFSQTVSILRGSLLSDLIETLPQNERYSYVFEGNSQDLDHVLVSSALSGHVSLFDVVHVNSEFSAQASDHDPPVVHLCADATAPTLSVSVSPSSLFPPNHRYVEVTATVIAGDAIDPAPTFQLVSATSNEPDNAPGDADGNTVNDVVVVNDTTFRLRAERSETGNGRIYTITYRATDACGNATTKSATVTVPLRS